MEKEYDKAIHHISTLILQNNYNRALSILNHLEEQGVTNCQVTVMQSYCIKNVKGINAAINLLRMSPNKGPLIQMALAQYFKELNNNFQSFQALSKIQGNKRDKNVENAKSDINKMLKNMQIFLHPEQKPPECNIKYGQIDTEAINKVNQIVEKHKKKQIRAEITYQMLKQVKEQRKLQGKLAQIVSRFIRYLEHQIIQNST